MYSIKMESVYKSGFGSVNITPQDFKNFPTQRLYEKKIIILLFFFIFVQ